MLGKIYIRGGEKHFVALLVLLFLSTSCADNNSERGFDTEAFKTDKYNLVLCFDLRDDERPVAGLTIQGNASQSTTASDALQSDQKAESVSGQSQQPVVQHVVILPFDVKSIQKNRNLLVTWGSYKDFTVINYIANTQNREIKGISISPVLGTPPQPIPQIEDLKENVYLIRSGLERRFIYKYQPSNQVQEKWPTELKYLPRDVLDAIGVATPPDSKGIEIRNNLTAIPNYEAENGIAKFYPASLEKANTKYLEVRYAVEASKPQKLFAEIALKVLAANIIPLLELWLLGAAEIFRPRTRRIVMWGGLALQIIILSVLIWIAFNIKGEIGEKTIIEGVNVFIGAVFTGLVLFIKRNPKQVSEAAINANQPPANKS